PGRISQGPRTRPRAHARRLPGIAQDPGRVAAGPRDRRASRVRSLRALLLVSALAGVAAGAGWMLWSGTEPDRASRERGRARAAALRAGIAASPAIRAPHRCARLDPDELGPDVAAVAIEAPGMRSARRRGPILELASEPASDAFPIGI